MNAVYLKAEWAVPFVDDDTGTGHFDTAHGTIRIPTMETFGGQEPSVARAMVGARPSSRYVGVNGSQPLAMTIVMPDNLEAFEAHLTPSAIRRVDAAIAREQTRLADITYANEDCGTYPYDLRLFMPKFGTTPGPDLVPNPPVDGDDDRDGPGGGGSHRHHRRGPALDRRGRSPGEHRRRRAGHGGRCCDCNRSRHDGQCGPPSPRDTRTLHLDHPFLFLIRDVETGAILFMGRVTDPSEGTS